MFPLVSSFTAIRALGAGKLQIALFIQGRPALKYIGVVMAKTWCAAYGLRALIKACIMIILTKINV